MSIDSSIVNNREAILSIAETNGAARVRILGSAVHGTFDSESEVDLLIDMAPDRHLLDLVAIKQDVEALLGRRVHVVTEAAVSPYIREEIVRSAIPL